MRGGNEKGIGRRALEGSDMSELGAQGRSDAFEDFIVDGVTFKPLHKHAALSEPAFHEGVKFSREQLARPAHPKIRRFRKDNIPLFRTAPQNTERVAEADFEARIVLNAIGSR